MTNRKQLNEQALNEFVEELTAHPEYIAGAHITYVPPTPPRYVAFPNGAVSEVKMTREEFSALRTNSPQWANTLDVTPDPCRLAVHVALGLNTWWGRPSTSLQCFPCPDCSDGSARWLVCETCGGSRRVPTVAWVAR
jgi:hypothetical protein